MATAALLAAGAGIALIDWLTSKGQTLTITDNITTDMIINASFTSKTNCITSETGSQNITIVAGEGYEAISDKMNDEKVGSCGYCLDQLEALRNLRNKLDADATNKNPNYTGGTPSDTMKKLMEGGSFSKDTSAPANLGACDLVCADIVVLNVQQSQTFKAKTECKVDNQVSNSLNQSINGTISAFLTNHQDILGQLGDAFTTNTSSIVNNLATTMGESVSTVVKQNLLNAATSAQSFNIGVSNSSQTDGAHSLYVNSVKESFTSKSVANLTVNNQVNNSLRQSADYSISQTLLNKNDTIGDISKDFLKVIETMATLVETLTGQILIILGAVLAIIFLIVGSMFVFDKGFRNTVNSVINDGVKSLASGRIPGGQYKLT
jgi:hypothetical protein